ncbi:hypothetical protein [uncultured Microbacterium sp.]|uniref:hypothetical protein n=1 Tax=uncultured Microbacterium sp. TaxID=191216 RepID=UPI0028D29889|nr:hypothetical protein [uncultured Microbacterium sp.]
MRYSAVTMELITDPLWGRWPVVDSPDSEPTADIAVRIVDHDRGASYIVKVEDRGDRLPAQIIALWRAPQSVSADWSAVEWMPDQAIAERARLFLRRRWEHTQRDKNANGWAYHYAEAELLDGDLTPEEVAIQVRIARAAGVPIVKWFTEEHGHPWRLSARTAARRIAEARAAGLLPAESGVRGPGARATRREERES